MTISPQSWVLKEPVKNFFFDFDGTLSLMEGIDALAEMNGVAEQVQTITQRCMAETGLTVESYRERLDLVSPQHGQLEIVAKLYQTHCTPGALEVIKLLQYFDKNIYIISAGIRDTLLPLAADLSIAPEQVMAVNVYFKQQDYMGFDENSELVRPQGKNKVIQQVLQKNERSLLVGDGLSDWEAHTVVTRFVGFAGLKAKAKVRDNSAFYINCNRLYSLINLGLTYQEQMQIPEEFKNIYKKGIADIDSKQVLIKE